MHITTVPRVKRTSLLLAFLLALFTAGGLVTLNASPAFADSTLCSDNSYSVCINLGYTDHGYGEKSDWSTHQYWSELAGHNCTNYAAYVEQTVNGASTPSPNHLGDAYQWDNNAAADGITVNTTPGLGSVAQWEANIPGISGSAGHVAYVESVNKDTSGNVTSITVSADNWSSGPFWWKTISVGSSIWPSHFIHFKDIPTLTTSSDLSQYGAVHGDFNGDGYMDVAMLYDWGNNNTAMLLMSGSSTGLHFSGQIWSAQTDSGFTLNWDRAKIAAGDFNGDGYTDVGILYDWGNNNTAMLLMSGSSTGLHWVGQIWSAQTDSGFTMNWDRTKIIAGDFNGDGYDDMGMLYDWGNNNTAMLVMSGSSTGLRAAGQVWSAQVDAGFTMNWDRTRLTAGDFNGDGKVDVAILYDWGNNNTAMLVSPGSSTSLRPPGQVWSAGGAYSWDSSRIVAGDFNGDGKADLAMFYDYGGPNVAMLYFNGTSSGLSWAGQAWSAQGVMTPAMSLTSSKFVAGDFNGDGKYDIGILYDYGNQNTAMLLFNGSSTGPSWVGQIWSAQQDSGFSMNWSRTKIG